MVKNKLAFSTLMLSVLSLASCGGNGGECSCPICTEEVESEPSSIVHEHTPGEWRITETQHWRVCSVCHQILDKANHSFSDWQVADPATCLTPGTWKRVCSICGYEETKTDEAGLGHEYGETYYDWADDHSTCTATRACVRGDSTETAEGHVTDKKVGASCTEAGEEIFTATFDVPWATTQIEKETLDVLGHEYGETTYEWGGVDSCTATRACVRGDSTETAEATVTSEITLEATCTEAGVKNYTATFDVPWADVQTKEEPVNPLGHDFEDQEIAYTWNADYSVCTATQKCSRCDVTRSAATSDIAKTVKNESYRTQGEVDTLTATFAGEGDDVWANGVHSEDVTLAAPWADVPMNENYVMERTPTSGIALTEADGHAFAISDEVATYTGYNNGGIVLDNLESLSKGRNILTFDFMGGQWPYNSTYPALIFIFTDTAGTSTMKEIKFGEYTNRWNEGWECRKSDGTLITDETVNSLTEWYSMRIDVSSYLSEGASLAKLEIVDRADNTTKGVSTISLKNVILKETTHSRMTTVSTGSQVSDYCEACGEATKNYVDGFYFFAPSAHKANGYFSYQTGVTFDGRSDCLETTTTANTNAYGGYANWYVVYENLVKNAQKANKPVLKIHFYVESGSSSKVALYWQAVKDASASYASSAAYFSRSDLAHWNATTSTAEPTPCITDEKGNPMNSSNGLMPNQWGILTLNASAWGDDVVSFGLGVNRDDNSPASFPIHTYISRIEMLAA